MADGLQRRDLLRAALALPAAACATRAAAPPPPAAPAPAPPPPLTPVTGPTRLLVRADDMGSTHGANVGCIRAVREGIARSVEVIVPGPWFPEAVRLLNQHPDVDVGVHLCLNSEWENARWRPLTRAPSLVDADGFFFPMTRQRRDFPPGTALFHPGFSAAEAEAELRAQIELLRRHVPRVTHASAHMGAANMPELRELTAKLLQEYGLAGEVFGGARIPFPPRAPGPRQGFADTEARLAAALTALAPGDYLLVQHPATDDAEMRAIGHRGYYTVAAERSAETAALTSPRVLEIVRRRGIQLVSYGAVKAAVTG